MAKSPEPVELAAPLSYVLHVDPKGRRWHVNLEWDQIDGRFEVVGIHVRSNPDANGNHVTATTADDIRRMPLGTLIKDAKRRHAANVLRMAAKYGDAADEAHDLADRWGPRQGRHLTHDDLERAAAAYIQASGVDVTRAVAIACNVSESTAGKRIMAARKAGLIPERRTR